MEGEHHSGALLDAGAPGEWDADGVAAPHVVLGGPKGDFRLFYTGRGSDGRTAIGLARSADGFAWKRAGVVLAAGEPGAFDEHSVGAPCVVRIGQSEWLMFYEGRSADGRRAIGQATSDDGLRWRRLSGGGTPLLEGGAQGAWDAGGVGCPFAVGMAGGRWRLYYEGYGSLGTSSCGVGLALSDGASTTRFSRRRGGAASSPDGVEDEKAERQTLK